MRVLVACEESQTVCKAFRARGHKAYSCDIQPPSGGHPEWHFHGDIFEYLDLEWDLMIAHPPCTYLSAAANGWLNVERHGQKAIDRGRSQQEAYRFFMRLYNYEGIHRRCIENPLGYVNRMMKPTQIIDPWNFGEPVKKRTCLWLVNLPPLKWKPEVLANPGAFKPEGRRAANGKIRNWCDTVPDVKDRQKIRSKTFQSIADAMAEQWG